MNKPVSVLNGLKQVISGNFLDAAYDSPFELPNDHMVVAYVPDELRDIISRTHPLFERMMARQKKSMKSIFVDHNFDEKTLVNLESSGNEHKAVIILAELAHLGLLCKIHDARMYFGQLGIFKGWRLGLCMNTGFKLQGGMFFEPNHSAVKFFDTFSDIFKGKCLFEGSNGLNEYVQGEIVVGEVTDQAMQQLVFFRKNLLRLLGSIDPYPGINSEIVAFKNKSVDEYASFRCRACFMARCVKLVNSTINSCMEEMINHDLIPSSMADRGILATEVRDNWKIVISH